MNTPTLLQRLKRSLVNEPARFYRSTFLKRTTFIGVTGSCGKTTTKELIDAVLSTRLQGKKTPDNCNEAWHVPRIIGRVRPDDSYCVLEIGACGPGTLDLPLRLAQPTIGVVTNIGLDHITQYGDIEAIASEKGKLVAVLPANGTAVLNADDPRVLAMQSRCDCNVITYGLSDAALLRATNIQCKWPKRLSFTALYEGQSAAVETQLCGTHWVPDALAALAVGIAMGIPFDEAVAGLRAAPPFNGRMSPVEARDGVTFIRDDQKAPYWSVGVALDFVRQATASRKIIVIGTLSDYQGHSAAKYLKVAREAVQSADYAFFVGRWASRCLRARRRDDDASLQAFATVDELESFLHGFLKPGNLVLLKGSERGDALEHIVHRWDQRAAVRPSSDGAQATSTRPQPMPPIPQTSSNGSNGPAVKRKLQVIVGLGNPGGRFTHTPHNVGQRLLDHLAHSCHANWNKENDTFVARATHDDMALLLVKADVGVNDTGPVVARLAHRCGFGPGDCVILHDDLDLPLGAVRYRIKGSAGGHNGMASIINAFQCEDIRRVKIGVGRPPIGMPVEKFVLQPFDTSQQQTVQAACTAAATRMWEVFRGKPWRPLSG